MPEDEETNFQVIQSDVDPDELSDIQDIIRDMIDHKVGLAEETQTIH